MKLGSCSYTDPHLYKLNCCPFCTQCCEVSVRVKPATAGLRVLSIDGGGIRAAIPIQFLCALEKAVGLDMPIQELFDVAYGTSSGMLPQKIRFPFSAFCSLLCRRDGGSGALRSRHAS
jgi:hypothetical protein